MQLRCPHGAFILVQIGLIDWAYARMMRYEFPKIRVEEDSIFINAGAVWTSAGLAAGFDVAVAKVEKIWEPRSRDRWRVKRVSLIYGQPPQALRWKMRAA